METMEEVSEKRLLVEKVIDRLIQHVSTSEVLMISVGHPPPSLSGSRAPPLGYGGRQHRGDQPISSGPP